MPKLAFRCLVDVAPEYRYGHWKCQGRNGFSIFVAHSQKIRWNHAFHQNSSTYLLTCSLMPKHSVTSFYFNYKPRTSYQSTLYVCLPKYIKILLIFYPRMALKQKIMHSWLTTKENLTGHPRQHSQLNPSPQVLIIITQNQQNQKWNIKFKKNGPSKFSVPSAPTK